MFAFIWVVLFPISFWSAHIGVLLWIWVALLSPNELLYGFMGGVPFNKIVALTTILLLVFNQEKKKFYVDKMLVLLALFAMSGTMSWLTSIADTTTGNFQYDKFIKELLLAFIITGVMWSRHRLHMTVVVVCIAYGFLSVKEGLIFLLTAGGHKVIGTGSVGDNNALALAILMTIPLMLYVAQYSAVRLVRIAALGTALLGVTTVIATYSRGGFLGLVVLGLLLLRKSKRKIGSLVALLICAAVIYYFAPPEWFSRLDTIKEADTDSSFMTRVIAWKVSVMVALDHPFFGGGFYATLDGATWRHYGDMISELDFLVPTPLAGNKTFVAHSIYFQALADLGFVGLGLFLLILAASFWSIWRIKRMCRLHPSLAWAADLAKFIEISLAVYAVAGGALSLIYFELLYIILAVLSRTHQTVWELSRGLVFEGKAAPRWPAAPGRGFAPVPALR